jgi:hypothetical protein
MLAGFYWIAEHLDKATAAGARLARRWNETCLPGVV